jgi:hypothetical protein
VNSQVAGGINANLLRKNAGSSAGRKRKFELPLSGTKSELMQTTFASQADKWRKRVGVEPTDDTARCHPPVLKTVRTTGSHALPHGKH